MAPGELGLQHFKALRAALEALPTGDVDALFLKTQLEKGKAVLRSPLQLLPTGDSGAADLSKGWFTPYGSTKRWNITGSIDHFKQEVASLAQQLGISERHAASLLSLILGDRRPLPDRSQDENVVFVYYAERRDLLVCLKLIFAYLADKDLYEALDRNAKDTLIVFANELVTYSDGQSRSWIRVILDEIDKQDTAQKVLVSGPSNTGFGASNSTQVQGRFSDDITAQRKEAHAIERQLLASVLYHVAAAGDLFSASDIYTFVTKAATRPVDDVVTPVYAITILAIFGSNVPENASNESLRNLASFVQTTANWKLSPLQPLTQLMLCVYLCRMHGSYNTTIKDVKIEEPLKKSVYDAFDLCRNGLLRFKKPLSELEDLCWTGGTQVSDAAVLAALDTDLEESALREVDKMLENIIHFCMKPLKEVRYTEEDPRRRPNATSRARRLSNASQEQTPVQQHPSTIDSLFHLVALLYRDRPDVALKYWEPNSSLFSFVRWAATSHEDRLRSLFQMFGSLATGRHCAGELFITFARSAEGPIAGRSLLSQSWSDLFNAFESSAFELSSSRQGQEMDQSQVREQLLALRAFLAMVRNTARYFLAARAYFNGDRAALTSLIRFIVNPTYLELKAALLDVLTSLAAVGITNEELPGPAGIAAVRQIWTIVEDNQMIPTRPSSDGQRQGNNMSIPLSQELEHVEPRNRAYPGTIALISLLTALVGGTAGLSDQFLAGRNAAEVHVEPTSLYIPQDLGAPNRPSGHGIRSYTAYVIDTVLLSARKREYTDPNELWHVSERCLAFIERCLAGMHPQDLIAIASTDTQALPAVTHLATQPGFDILVRILGGTPLLTELLSIIAVEIAVLDAQPVNVMRTHSVLRALRILLQVFALQSALMEVALPVLQSFSQLLPQASARLLRQLKTLDVHLLYNAQSVTRIADLVGCLSSKSIGLASIRILSYLADSSSFDTTDVFKNIYTTRINRLAGLIDASTGATGVIESFVKRLANAPEFADLLFSQDVSNSNEVSTDHIEMAIQSSILDLLLHSTQSHFNAPNIAHLLLGFKLGAQASQLEVQEADGSNERPYNCLHVLVDYLTRISSDLNRTPSQTNLPNVLLECALVAEKMYRLIRQLCLHAYTSSAVTAYFRSHDILPQQAAALPMPVYDTNATDAGTLLCADGSKIQATLAQIIPTLHAQAWLLETLALELATLAEVGLTDEATQLLSILYGVNTTLNDDDTEQQNLPRMLEIFSALDFGWEDALAYNETPIAQPLADLDYNSCLKADARECIVYDVPAVIAMLRNARRRSNVQQSALQMQELDLQERAILENLVIENNRRGIQHARVTVVKAWRVVLDISLTRTFALLPSAGSGILLLDILDRVLPPLAAEDVEASLQAVLAEAAVLLMASIRQIGIAEAAASLGGSGSRIFSSERLLPLLSTVLAAVTRSGIATSLRGNLYAFLLLFIQHSETARAAQTAANIFDGDDASIMSLESGGMDGVRFETASTVGGSRYLAKRSPLQSGVISILQSSTERLLPTVCLDATAGSQVWQTVALTLLDALARMAGQGSPGSHLATLLSKQGYLQGIVDSLKESETELLQTLEPEPESLNSLYIYEAKMAFLMRLAATKEGADRLLASQLLSRLSQCAYFEIESYVSGNDSEFDTFVPPAQQRAHQLLLPALQLLAAVAEKCGSHDLAVSRQLQAFLLSQRDAIRSVLQMAALLPTSCILQEVQIIAHLMTLALPTMSNEDFIAPSGFGGLHSNLLGLAAVLMAEQEWISNVSPTTDEEAAAANELTPDFPTPIPEFRVSIHKIARRLQSSMLSYMREATARPGSSTFRAVWLPTLQLSNDVIGGSALPTLRSVLVYLSDIVQELLEIGSKQTEVMFRIENFDSVPTRDLDMFDDFQDDIAPIDGLDERTSRSRILRNMHTISQRYKQRAITDTHIVELVLLLLWRHLRYYLEQAELTNLFPSGQPQVNGHDSAMSSDRRQKSLSFRSLYGTQGLRETALEAFRAVIGDMEQLTLDKVLLGAEARSHEVLVSSLVRSITDLLSVESNA